MNNEKIATGFDFIDDILGGGLAPGGITVIFGRPGMGKWSLANEISMFAMKNFEQTILIFPEMPYDAGMWLYALGIAKTRNVPVILTVNVPPEAVENREDKFPLLSDLKEALGKDSCGILNVADVFIGISRESYYDPSLPSSPSDGEVSVTQMRYGEKCGRGKLTFYPEIQIWIE